MAVAAAVLDQPSRLGSRRLYRVRVSALQDRWPVSLTPLTGGEQETLELIVDGYSKREIATLLTLAPSTIQNRIHRTFGKLNARTHLHLALVAHDAGLVDLSASAQRYVARRAA